MTSSLRNSLHRRNHKERSQLAHRTKLGILEKHGDYVKRARDYHSKQDRLNRLKQKVAERNKDEFYFAMTKEKTKGGVHLQSRGNVALPTDIVKVLKTQDENYIRTMRAAGLKKIDRIKDHLTEMADLLSTESVDKHMADGLDETDIKTLKEAKILSGSKITKKRKHIIFAENAEEGARLSAKGKGKEVADVQSATQRDEEDDLGWMPESSTKRSKSRRRKSVEVLTQEEDDGILDDTGSNQLDKRKRLLSELSARLDRDKKLLYAQRELEMQRLLMGKGARRKIVGVEKVEGDKSEEDEDEIDARKGRRLKTGNKVLDMDTYRPRQYKWRQERNK